MAGSVYGTLEGSNIEIGCDGESLTVNGIKMVLKKDIVTSNGVIHLINQVLMPDSGETLYLPTDFIFTSLCCTFVYIKIYKFIVTDTTSKSFKVVISVCLVLQPSR